MLTPKPIDRRLGPGERLASVLAVVRAAGPQGIKAIDVNLSLTCSKQGAVDALLTLAERGQVVGVPITRGRLWVTPEHVEECQRLLAEAQRAPKKADDAPVVPERTIHYATRPATALPAGYVSPLDPRECRPWAAVAVRGAA